MAAFIVTIVIGVGLFLLGWFQYRKARASRAWPAVAGRILSAKVESETSRGDEDSPDSTSYFPAVEYEYQVGSAAFRGNQIEFGRRVYSKPQDADKALLAFPVGSSVQVFHHPARPGACVLERKASAGWPLMVIGGLIALVGVLTAVTR
jgi:hypothetical protein